MDPARDAYHAPLVRRILASVGAMADDAAVRAALARVRGTSLGSDTGSDLGGVTADKLRGVYGRWRQQASLFTALDEDVAMTLARFGYASRPEMMVA